MENSKIYQKAVAHLEISNLKKHIKSNIITFGKLTCKFDLMYINRKLNPTCRLFLKKKGLYA